MFLLPLPVELIFQIVECFDTEGDASALSRTNRASYDLLLDKRYKFNLRHRGGAALVWAAKHGQVKVMKELVNAGADLDVALDKHGDHPHTPPGFISNHPPGAQPLMTIAAEAGQESVIDYLQEMGQHCNVYVDREWTPLTKAIEKGNISMVQKLFANGAKITSHMIARDRPTRWRLPKLKVAASNGDLNMVRVLTENITERYPDERQEFLDECLDAAGIYNHRHIIKYLRSQGARD
ncbi:ankyrin repeat-containing domain protein [Aspergillus coremiiformis]|uniref:Ankyrin repeat-containing domain protein n=1 Tax=Aspergillus coremiiformis TaxID=138285 RepID=A0A5N6ZF64_9EURO|nr:ankyrin repeat-containing domain protein [Aspergillus coremiiformis]